MNNDENIVAQVLVEFIEVAIHNILQCKKLYPDTIFEKQQKYGVIVYKSIHPQLNEYISECIKTIHELVKKNQIAKFVLCFMKPRNVLEEKIVFDIMSLKSQIDTDTYLLQLEKSLRTFCVRLYSSQGYLEPLSEDATFSIQIYTTDEASMEHLENPHFQHFPWFHVDPSLGDIPQSAILPIHTVQTDFMAVQIYIERKFE